MNITLQATGYAPRTIEASRVLTSTQMVEGDKRGVRVALYQTRSGYTAEVQYLTTWGTERPFTWIVNHLGEPALDRCAEWVRTLAPNVLPPGAGFPATPSFETRQAKLQGMMQTLTLVALSEVLAQV